MSRRAEPEQAAQDVQGDRALGLEPRVREARFAHRRLVQVARLRFTELVDAQGMRKAQQRAGLSDVGLDFIRSGRKRVGLAFPEVVYQIDQLFGLDLSGYINTSQPA